MKKFITKIALTAGLLISITSLHHQVFAQEASPEMIEQAAARRREAQIEECKRARDAGMECEIADEADAVDPVEAPKAEPDNAQKIEDNAATNDAVEMGGGCSFNPNGETELSSPMAIAALGAGALILIVRQRKRA